MLIYLVSFLIILIFIVIFGWNIFRAYYAIKCRKKINCINDKCPHRKYCLEEDEKTFSNKIREQLSVKKNRKNIKKKLIS